MYIDASDHVISAVLMQQDARGKQSTVAYVSRTLNQDESN